MAYTVILHSFDECVIYKMSFVCFTVLDCYSHLVQPVEVSEAYFNFKNETYLNSGYKFCGSLYNYVFICLFNYSISIIPYICLLLVEPNAPMWTIKVVKEVFPITFIYEMLN